MSIASMKVCTQQRFGKCVELTRVGLCCFIEDVEADSVLSLVHDFLHIWPNCDDLTGCWEPLSNPAPDHRTGHTPRSVPCVFVNSTALCSTLRRLMNLLRNGSFLANFPDEINSNS